MGGPKKARKKAKTQKQRKAAGDHVSWAGWMVLGPPWKGRGPSGIQKSQGTWFWPLAGAMTCLASAWLSHWSGGQAWVYGLGSLVLGGGLLSWAGPRWPLWAVLALFMKAIAWQWIYPEGRDLVFYAGLGALSRWSPWLLAMFSQAPRGLARAWPRDLGEPSRKSLISLLFVVGLGLWSMGAAMLGALWVGLLLSVYIMDRLSLRFSPGKAVLAQEASEVLLLGLAFLFG